MRAGEHTTQGRQAGSPGVGQQHLAWCKAAAAIPQGAHVGGCVFTYQVFLSSCLFWVFQVVLGVLRVCRKSRKGGREDTHGHACRVRDKTRRKALRSGRSGKSKAGGGIVVSKGIPKREGCRCGGGRGVAWRRRLPEALPGRAHGLRAQGGGWCGGMIS